MMSGAQRDADTARIGEVMAAVQIPLENVEFTLEHYLLANGQRLDTETRMLLAHIRDSIGRVVVSTRSLSHRERTGAGRAGIGRAA